MLVQAGRVSADTSLLQQSRRVTKTKLSMEVVGEVLAEERKKLRTEFEAEIAKLRIEFLRDRLDQERGVKRQLKPVPIRAH